MTTKRPTMLSEQDEKIAVARLMAGAQAHQRASVYCMDKPDAKPPNIDWFYFNVVSFELILMSVEQSLRLLLLLHYGIIRADTGHVPHVLYKAILRESGGKSGIRRDIVATANAPWPRSRASRYGRKGDPGVSPQARLVLREFQALPAEQTGRAESGLGVQTPGNTGGPLPSIGAHPVEHGRDNEAQASGPVHERRPRVGNDRRYPGFEGAHAGTLTAIHAVLAWARDSGPCPRVCGSVWRRWRRRWRRPIRLRDDAETLGKLPRFKRLTPPQSGFSVYGMETSSTRDSRRRRPSGALAGGLSGTLKVPKPADAVLTVEHCGLARGRYAPLRPPASRAGARAAAGTDRPREPLFGLYCSLGFLRSYRSQPWTAPTSPGHATVSVVAKDPGDLLGSSRRRCSASRCHGATDWLVTPRRIPSPSALTRWVRRNTGSPTTRSRSFRRPKKRIRGRFERAPSLSPHLRSTSL